MKYMFDRLDTGVSAKPPPSPWVVWEVLIWTILEWASHACGHFLHGNWGLELKFKLLISCGFWPWHVWYVGWDSWDNLHLSHSLPLVLGGWHEDNTTLVSTSSTLSERPSLTPTVLLPKISDQLLVPALGYEGWGVLSREVSLWLSERLVFYLSVHLEQLSSPGDLAKSPCLSWRV